MKVKTKTKGIKIYCDISKCTACKTCELACAVEHSKSKVLESATREKEAPKRRLDVARVDNRAVSIHCQHCADAPCVAACMSGALQKDKKTGATLQDREKCVGCWMCVMTCPFGAIVRDIENHVAVKCDLCPDRETFACVEACPTGSLFSGTEEEFRTSLRASQERAKQSQGMAEKKKKI